MRLMSQLLFPARGASPKRELLRARNWPTVRRPRWASSCARVSCMVAPELGWPRWKTGSAGNPDSDWDTVWLPGYGQVSPTLAQVATSGGEAAGRPTFRPGRDVGP